MKFAATENIRCAVCIGWLLGLKKERMCNGCTLQRQGALFGKESSVGNIMKKRMDWILKKKKWWGIRILLTYHLSDREHIHSVGVSS